MLIRPDLADAPTYVAGKSIPGSIKLASNESPHGPLPSVATALASAGELINRYPDPAGTLLATAIAGRLGVEPGQVVLGNGSVTLCQHIVQATCSPGDAVVTGWRSFEAYPILARNVAARFVRVPLKDHTFDLAAIRDEVARLRAEGTRVGTVFICNPNNPTGTTVGAAELRAFLDDMPGDVAIVLDEAYREFAGDDFADGLDLIRRPDGSPRENVIVLRTFSKAYGLAGLRVGYGIGQPTIIDAVRAVTLPFSVNALAQAAALESLRPEAHTEMLQRVKETVTERARVIDGLRDQGAVDSRANFVWLPTGADTAALDAFLQERKLIARPFAGEGLRVTISTPEENDLLLAAMREWAQRG